MSYQIDSYGNAYFPAGVSVASIPATTGTQNKVLVPGPGGRISSASISQLITQSGGSLVSSIFGRTGAITALRGDYNTDQVTEGQALYFSDSRARKAINLTTFNTSGPATYDSTTGILNIPQYGSGIVGNYVPVARTITINGQTADLSANRTFTIDAMVYPSSGIPVSNGTAWGNSIVNNSSNWNTAYSWGDHAGLYSLLGHTHTFSSLTSKPTTLAGYGITDAATSTQGTRADTAFGWGDHSTAGYLTSATAASIYLTQSAASSTYLTSSTASTTYLTQSAAATTYLSQSSASTIYVSLLGSYSNPTFITSLSWSKISGAPAFLTSYTETDPIWTSEKVNYYTKTQADGRYLQSFTETDPIWTSEKANYALKTYVDTSISNLIDSAPSTLDTLNELAAALGDDANFSTSITTLIGTKEPAITAGTTAQYWRGDKTWQTLPIYTLSGLGGVPTSRTLTINGTSYDLSADRSWTINSMVYPSAGIAVSTGSAWGTSITDNSTNWNTAYGWGNHASAGYLTTATAASTYASLSGAYSNPAFVASLAWSKITGAPAFLTSYTETDPIYTASSWYGTTNNASNWNTAFSDRFKWDGGSSGLNASTGRTSLGLGTAATANTGDFAAASHTHSIANVSGLQTALDGKESTITAGTTSQYWRGDKTWQTLPVYTLAGLGGQPQLNGTGFVKASGTTISYDNSTYYLASNPSGYISGNQNITLSGEVTGSGATSIVTTIANNAVTTAKINNGSITAAKMATFGAGEGFFWAANTDGASIVFESTGDGASGGRALSNLLIALSDNGDEGLKVTSSSTELFFVNTNQIQYKGANLATQSYVTSQGYLTGITSLQVTNALGYTPYNSSNPSGYITGNQTITLSGDVSGSGTTSISVTVNRLTYQGNYANNDVGTSRGPDGLSLRGVYTNGYPIQFGNILHMKGWGAGQLLVGWSGTDGAHADNYIRSKRDNDSGAWSSWAKVWTDANLTNLNQLSNGPGYITSSSLSGYLPLSGGSLSGVLTTNAQLAVADNIVIYGNNKQIQWNAAASSDLFISCIPNTRTIEIRNGNAGSPNYAACGLITGYATFTANVTVQGNLTVSSSNTTGGGIILADDGDIVDLNDAYCSMRFSYGVRIYSANRGGSPVITLANTGVVTASSFVGSLSGNATTASSISGFNNPTTAANANTIVYRDGNAHIFGNYILGTYFNASSGNSENPTIGQIWTQSTGDNYLRKSTPSHFISQLGLITSSNISSQSVSYASYSGYSQGDFLHSDRDFPSGTLIQTNINYAVEYGDPWVLEIRGFGYNGAPPFDIQLAGYIYYNTIINQGGYSNGTNISGLRAINYNGNLCFWFPYQGYWQGYNVKAYVPYGGRQSNRVTSISNTGQPTTAKQVDFNLVQSLHSSNYNSYSPTLTGGNASGTWGINITGNSSNITAHTINQSVGTGNTPTFAGAILGCGVSTGRGVYGPGTLNLILTSSSAGSDGVCGIDFRSGNNYPSDGASIYYENSQTGSGEVSRLVIRVENDLNDSILMRAGYHVYNARTVDNASQGADNPVFRWQYLDSNRMSLDSSGNLVCSGDITAYGSPSDSRLKTIKETVQDPIDKIMKISGYRFDWNDINTTLNVKEDVGVIAQEIAEVLPELTRTNENGYMSVRYQGLTALLIEGMKEQQLQIEELKKEIKELKNK